MAEERVQRKDLWKRLGAIKKKKVWIKAAQSLGLEVTQPKGGGSHNAIRLPGFERSDMKGFICNVYNPVRRDMSESVFKKLLDNGLEEDAIWTALGMFSKEDNAV